MKIPTLKKHYLDNVVPALRAERGYTNPHTIPRIEKVVINTGISSQADKAIVNDAIRDLTLIGGQKAVPTKARKAIANFKLREGQIIGARVTLRGVRMWEFLTRLIVVALPSIRDFRGLSPKFDGHGNYTLGISDHSIFPEIAVESTKRQMGLDVTITTSAKTDDEGRLLLRLLGFPFRNVETTPKTNQAA